MKKSLLALAALTAFAGVASAQSTVTLFGIVDLAATSVKNGGGGTVKTLAQDGNSSTRLGFRGVEDLGGGLRAGFWIEGAFGADTGCGGSGTIGTPATCAGQTWQRRSTVSLIGGFGEIRLGRDYTPTFFNVTVFDPFGTNGIGSALQTRSALGVIGTGVRANNTIGYFLPAMGGLYGQIQVAAGEANSTGNKYIGGRLGYAAGPLNVAGAWAKTYKTGTMVDDATTMNFGASFNMGFMTLQGSYDKNEYSIQDQTNILVGVLVPLGSGTLKASYIKASGSTGVAATNDTLDATQMTVGYVYDLSKRTALYAHYARINNEGGNPNGARFSLYGANGSNLVGFLGGQTSSGFQFGIRHSF